MSKQILLSDLARRDKVYEVLPVDMPYRTIVANQIREYSQPPSFDDPEPKKFSINFSLLATSLLTWVVVILYLMLRWDYLKSMPLAIGIFACILVLSPYFVWYSHRQQKKRYEAEFEQYIKTKASHTIRLINWSGCYLDLDTEEVGHPKANRTAPIQSIESYLDYLETL